MMKLLILLLFMFFMFNMMNLLVKQILMQFMFMYMYIMIVVYYSFSDFNYWMKIYYNMGCDIYSMGLVLLSLWIMMLMVMVSLNNFLSFNNLNFIFMKIFLLNFLFLCFFSMNMLMFYMYFESSLIPIFLMILGWGFQIDRIQAGYYMMLYTLFGSMPLFFMILYIYNMHMSLMFDFLKLDSLNWLMYLMMIMAFLIKMPMYLVHIWLPKAHVEAPLIGSMILAGVMLKMGSYGLLRFMLIMKKNCLSYNIYIMLISIMGGIYSSLVCMYQVDMKMLVAYSSVVHMSLLMSGMMTLFNLGYMGGYYMMIAHGLCSSGLFMLVNINYERLESRSIYVNKGMINFFPSLSLMWFLLCSSNMSFPPSLNLFSEILLISSLIKFNEKFSFIIMMILFISSVYTLFLYSFSQHGNYSKLIYFMKKILLNEYMILVLHWVPLNIIFMYMYMSS